MAVLIDISGQRFGRLTVIKYVGRNKHRDSLWSCRCECGTHTTVGKQALRSGNTTSCGCAKTDSLRLRAKHNKSPAQLYQCWLDMKKRCYNRNCINFASYGARGITVCDEWRYDYVAFRSFALSNGWKHGRFIDRINNDGGYSPANCRFVSRTESANNTTRTRWLTFRGQTLPIHQWATKTGIKQSLLRVRLWNGWTVERALTQPVQRQR